MSIDVALLEQIYQRFNVRDIEAVLAALHPDVTWANGMEGGHVHGREAVRSYWTRQWATIDPRVEPTRFSTGADGEIVVEVKADGENNFTIELSPATGGQYIEGSSGD